VIISEITVEESDSKSIGELLRAATEALSAAGVADARREASGLLELATGMTRTQIISCPEKRVEPARERVFFGYLERRVGREPFHYIAGVKEFYGLEFNVDKRVLIPRPETEILVEKVLNELQRFENPFFCEVGIGSGCIVVSILKNLPNGEAIGLDISKQAIDLATINMKNHGVASRLQLIESDIFANLPSGLRFDAIVSNPPYIAADDMGGLEPEINQFEPRNALTDEASGLTLVKRIVDGAHDLLNDSGFLAMEIGFDQKTQVEEMFSPAKWKPVSFIPDLQGHDRVVFAIKKGSRASNSLPVST
jgi:release factor glutamine methyltransferase